MAGSQYPKIEDHPGYTTLTKRAEEDKPPSRADGLGAVAHSRVPADNSRKKMAEAILAQVEQTNKF